MEHNQWTKEIETILQQICDKSYELSNLHKKEYFEIGNKLKYFKIPVIILSGINSVVSVGLTDYLDQSTISMATCLLALVVGIIGSIELFLKLNESLQSACNSGREFGLLHISIAKIMMLSREQRSISGVDFLNDIYSQYQTLVGSSNLLVNNVLHHGLTTVKVESKPSIMDSIKNKLSPSPSLSLSNSGLQEIELTNLVYPSNKHQDPT